MKIVINALPIGKARPRVCKGHAYTPQKTKVYENLVKQSYNKLPADQKIFYAKGVALEVTIVCYFPRPKSASKKQVERMIKGEIQHSKKPDVDNLAKAILDALNGLAYADDSQIAKLEVKKEYTKSICNNSYSVVWIEEK